jgi:hypothetical protein
VCTATLNNDPVLFTWSIRSPPESCTHQRKCPLAEGSYKGFPAISVDFWLGYKDNECSLPVPSHNTRKFKWHHPARDKNAAVGSEVETKATPERKLEPKITATVIKCSIHDRCTYIPQPQHPLSPGLAFSLKKQALIQPLLVQRLTSLAASSAASSLSLSSLYFHIAPQIYNTTPI